MRSGPKPVDSVAEIDARQIARQDLLLVKPRLKPKSDDDFLRLALEGPIARQKTGFRKLLSDRAPALPDTAASHIGDKGSRHSPRVDSPVAIKATILDR